MHSGSSPALVPLLLGLAVAAAPSALATHLLDVSLTGDPVASVADFTAAGVMDLTGAETVGNVFVTGQNNTSTLFTFSTGETMTLSSRARGAWSQAAETNEMLADYLYLEAGAGQGGPLTLSLGNLGLAASATYTLYLFGHNTQEANQDSTFTGISSPAVTFVSGESQTGTYAVEFTTSASFNSLSTVDFTWARSADSPNFAPLSGIAIVPAAVPEPATAAACMGGAVLLAGLVRRRRRV